jgi:gluconolactonase
MLAATGAAAAMTLTRTALGAGPNARYPDPAIQILDPAFAKYRIAQASVERLATGMRWCEGPVYFGDARCLLWSDIPNSRIMRWDEGTGRASVYRTRRTTPTATRATGKAGSSPVSTTAGA